MTCERRPSAGRALTRRRVLGLAAGGATALAGCAGLLGDESDRPTLDVEPVRLATLDTVPAVHEPLPVTVERSHVAAGRERVRSLLAGVPDPLTAATVPNGVVREDLARYRERAENGLRAAADPPTRYAALEEIRGARGAAAGLAAGVQVVEGDLTVADVEGRGESIRERIARRRHRDVYPGDDAVGAVLLHGAADELLDRASRRVDAVADPDEIPALAAAGVAADVERARGALGDATYLAERYLASLNGSSDYAERFETVGERLAGRIEDRAPTPPESGEPTDLIDADLESRFTPGREVLGSLYRDARVGESLVAGPTPARTVLRRHEQLIAVGALEEALGRLREGERFRPTDAEQLVDYRSAAVEAIRRGRTTEPYRPLVRRGLVHLDDVVRRADADLADRTAGEERVSVGSVDRQAGEYVRVGALARAAPAAGRTVGDALTRTG